MSENETQVMPLAIPDELYQKIQSTNESQKSSKDANYLPVNLTSQFKFYPFKKLSARPFLLQQQKKISRAQVTKDIKLIVEAINSCIDQDANQLTIGDFWYMMFWFRLNSWKKVPFTLTYTCQNELHQKAVLEGTSKKESLEQKSAITHENVVTKDLKDPDELDEFVASLDITKKGIKLHIGTVADMVEGFELVTSLNEENKQKLPEEDEYLLKYASVLSREHGITLQDRIDFLNSQELTPDDAYELDLYVERIEHGVDEIVTVTCSECGASRSEKVHLDALTFLPSLY